MKERIIIHFRTMEVGEIINIIIGTSMKEGFIIHFRTLEIEKILKIVMKTSIGMKISMIVIDLMIWMILMVEIGHIVETGYIVEIDHETTVEMSIRRKVINIREGLEIIMKWQI